MYGNPRKFAYMWYTVSPKWPHADQRGEDRYLSIYIFTNKRMIETQRIQKIPDLTQLPCKKDCKDPKTAIVHKLKSLRVGFKGIHEYSVKRLQH